MNKLMSPENFKIWLEAAFLALIGFTAVRIAVRASCMALAKGLDENKLLIFSKLTTYVLNTLILLLALDFAGVELKLLLGAAGVFTVAIGFASQTSASNLISGLFLIAEKPFKKGDVITVGERTGVVLAINLFSTRLRTLDNLLVRVPNETLMKSEITNVTHFPIRRADLQIPLSFDADLARVEKVLLELAESSGQCLDEPKPIFIVQGIRESRLDAQFSFWIHRDNFLKTKNAFYGRMITAFKESNIEISLPKMVHINRD
ncbi:MAG: mechanosensitive ion channel protein [Halobacteriovorax sp.]|nr:mechanosensitive ion channel protein [Halobacteriovorax sp.]